MPDKEYTIMQLNKAKEDLEYLWGEGHLADITRDIALDAIEWMAGK